MQAPLKRPEAAPTLLVGAGPVGRRVVKFLAERLGNSFLSTSGMLAVLEDPDEKQITSTITNLTRQRTVSAAEAGLELRAPFERYLRLQLLMVANAEELKSFGSPASYVRAANAFIKYPHPPEGLRLGFFIDVTTPESPVRTAQNLPTVLSSLEGLHSMSETEEWKRPLTRVVLAHRHLPDGVHLEHPNLGASDAAKLDEFELALSRLIEAMLSPGEDVLWGANGAPSFQFVTAGGGSIAFPRELLLSTTAGLLAADLLERTVLPENGPEPPINLLPTRGDLFRKLSAEIKAPPLTIVERSGQPPKPSWYERLFLGEKSPSHDRAGIGITTPSCLTALNGLSWEELAEQYQKEADAAIKNFEAALLASLSQLPKAIAANVLQSAREKLDALVTDELGGVDRARRSIEETQAALVASLTSSEQDLAKKAGFEFGTIAGSALEPHYVFASQDGAAENESEILQRFQKAVSRQPKPIGVLARALMAGSFAVPVVAATQGFLAGWITMGLSLGFFSFFWYVGGQKIERLRHRLLACFEDRLGKLAYDKVQVALGFAERKVDEETSLPVPGVIPQAWSYFERWETPLLNGFSELRETGIKLLRRSDAWPDGFLPKVDFLEIEDPFLLHREHQYVLADPSTADDAKSLLVQHKVFDFWRSPSFPVIEAAAQKLARDKKLSHYERLKIGEFLMELTMLHFAKDHEDNHAKRIVLWLEGLADKTLPFCPLPADWTPEDNLARSLRITVPQSLNWLENAKRVLGASDNLVNGAPSNSAFQDKITWLFGELPEAGKPDRVSVESDIAHVISAISAPDLQHCLAWVRHSFDVTPAFIPGEDDSGSLTRLALLIGNAAYHEKPLPSPIKNAKLLGGALAALGFKTTLVEDASQVRMEEKIDEFINQITEKSIVFFCFNGHGYELSGANFLSSIEGGAVNLDEIFPKLAEKRSLNIIVLDCCRSSFDRPGILPLQRAAPPANTLIAYATTEATVAYDSFYTPELAKMLQIPGLSIEDVFKRTRLAVMQKSQYKQVPWEESSLWHSVVLNPAVDSDEEESK